MRLPKHFNHKQCVKIANDVVECVETNFIIKAYAWLRAYMIARKLTIEFRFVSKEKENEKS